MRSFCLIYPSKACFCPALAHSSFPSRQSGVEHCFITGGTSSSSGKSSWVSASSSISAPPSFPFFVFEHFPQGKVHLSSLNSFNRCSILASSLFSSFSRSNSVSGVHEDWRALLISAGASFFSIREDTANIMQIVTTAKKSPA